METNGTSGVNVGRPRARSILAKACLERNSPGRVLLGSKQIQPHQVFDQLAITAKSVSNWMPSRF